MFAKLKRTAKQFLTGLIHEAEGDVAGIISAVKFREFRLWVRQIHMRRAAMLEHGNHRAGLRLCLRLTGFQIRHRLLLDDRRNRSRGFLLHHP